LIMQDMQGARGRIELYDETFDPGKVLAKMS
jgi:hypothetical protein